MRIVGTAIFLVVAALPSAAQSKVRGDPMCAPLLAFAASVGPDEERKVEFRTSWGRDFKDSQRPRVISAKRCDAFGYKPGESVCAFLTERGATEFSGGNAQRALACLSPGTKFGRVEMAHGAFHFRFGTEYRGALIDLRFEEDAKIGGMVLTITADGF